jgi:hypothetical protein
MGRFVAGVDRSQTTLFPDCLDDAASDAPSPEERFIAFLHDQGNRLT